MSRKREPLPSTELKQRRYIRWRRLRWLPKVLWRCLRDEHYVAYSGSEKTDGDYAVYRAFDSTLGFMRSVSPVVYESLEESVMPDVMLIRAKLVLEEAANGDDAESAVA